MLKSISTFCKTIYIVIIFPFFFGYKFVKEELENINFGGRCSNFFPFLWFVSFLKEISYIFVNEKESYGRKSIYLIMYYLLL